ncbi:WhiB family transcriptional regulator [Arcanobacterium canis]
MDWRSRAACLQEDPELFFPVGSSSPAMAQMERAKLVCQTCSVMETCLKVALETNQDCGVWGGKSEDERKALKRNAARATRVTTVG